MWSRFSSIKSYERVEMDMRELVLYKLIQGNTHVAARVNIYSDDMIYLLIETFLFHTDISINPMQVTHLFV